MCGVSGLLNPKKTCILGTGTCEHSDCAAEGWKLIVSHFRLQTVAIVIDESIKDNFVLACKYTSRCSLSSCSS